MRYQERPGKKSLVLSVAVHVVAVMAAWMATLSRAEPLDLITYQITLVSPPSTEEAPEPVPQPQEEVVVETPEPPPVEETPPVLEEEPEERRPTPTPTPTPPPPDPEPAGDPEPSEEISGEDLNVRMEGLRRDFPAYYGNIVRQIRRCMDYRGGGRWETSIFFYIQRDGTIDGRSIEFVERSGNVNFDYAAMGAVECAGGRFGPLPEDMGLDRIPILFTFQPGG
jgi:outer membrane biosynthesis protein TonB